MTDFLEFCSHYVSLIEKAGGPYSMISPSAVIGRLYA